MPHRRLANSVPALVRLFKTAITTYHNTPNAADRALPADLWARLSDTDPNSPGSVFLKEASEVDLAQAAQAPLSSVLSLGAARLTMFGSHFHQVFDLGTTRGDFAVGARSYYSRDVNAKTVPKLASYDEVQEVAQNIVKGEADRQTAEGASFVAMALPSASDVAAILTTFTAARQAAQQAEVNTDQEREDVTNLYAQAQELGVDIYAEVEHFYRKDPSASSFRAKCRRWGIVYLYDDNEPIDEGDDTGQKTNAGTATLPNEDKTDDEPGGIAKP